MTEMAKRLSRFDFELDPVAVECTRARDTRTEYMSAMLIKIMNANGTIVELKKSIHCKASELKLA